MLKEVRPVEGAPMDAALVQVNHLKLHPEARMAGGVGGGGFWVFPQHGYSRPGRPLGKLGSCTLRQGGRGVVLCMLHGERVAALQCL